MTTSTLPVVSYQGTVRITGEARAATAEQEAAIAARDRAAADRRLAALVDELADRDGAAIAARESRRPAVWLTVMTLGAVVLAQLAIAVAVASPL